MSLWLALRTAIDRIVAIVLAVLTAPIVGVAAVAVRRHDGGPPLITVDRAGRNGRIFRMWKVRSMVADGPGGRAGGLSLSGTADPRITPVGRRLRMWYLDELPQLWNVIAGDMALLGPRPEAPEWIDLSDPLWQRVLTARPGMAGPTQVIVNDWERAIIAESDDGSAYITKVLPVKLAIDRWYVESSSPTTDALVAITLLRRLLPGTESWTLKQRVFREVPEARVIKQWMSDRGAFAIPEAGALPLSDSGHSPTTPPQI